MVALGEGGASPFERTSEINCPLLFHFGEEDANPSPEDMQKLDAELTRYNKAHEFYTYPGAGHAFMDFTGEPPPRGGGDSCLAPDAGFLCTAPSQLK